MPRRYVRTIRDVTYSGAWTLHCHSRPLHSDQQLVDFLPLLIIVMSDIPSYVFTYHFRPHVRRVISIVFLPVPLSCCQLIMWYGSVFNIESVRKRLFTHITSCWRFMWPGPLSVSVCPPRTARCVTGHLPLPSPPVPT